MAKIYINESGKDQTYELFDDSPEVAFGRGAASDVQIADGHASKHHLVLRRQRGRWKLIDLESKNGTRVNGAFRNAHWLTHGDTVTVGSVVLRFDAEGQVSGAPPARAAVALPGARSGTAPAPRPVPAVASAVRPALGAAAASAQAPLVTLRAPAEAPASARSPVPPRQPLAAPAQRPSVARGAPRVRRETDDEGAEEGGFRPRPRARGLSGAVIVILGLVAVGVVFVILQGAMSGENPNSVARQSATQLIQKMQYEQALALLERDGVPSTPGYYAIVAEIAYVKGLIATKVGEAREAEAFERYNREVARVIAVGSLRPLGHPGDAEGAAILRRWFAAYGDTQFARTILNAKPSENAHYAGYQQIMRENPEPGRTETQALAELEAALAPLMVQQRLGAAYQRGQLAVKLERFALAPEAFARFEPRVENRLQVIKQSALSMLDSALVEGGGWSKRGEAGVGRAKVKSILRMLDWPEPDLQRHADDAMRLW